LISIGTSTTTTATYYPAQRKGFYANGRFWVFYCDGSNIVYCTSTNGSDWTSPTSVRSSSRGDCFSIWFDETYLHYAYAPIGSNVIYYRRGTPNADGTITWSAGEQQVTTVYGHVYYPIVTVDSNRYVWIGYTDYDANTAQYFPYIIKSGNNDGTWGSTPSPFPYCLSTFSSSYWKVVVVQLTSGKMLILYTYNGAKIKMRKWDGSNFGAEVQTTSMIVVNNYFSAVAQGDDVHLVFLIAGYTIVYVKYIYSTNSLGTEVNLKAATTLSTSAPVISIDTLTNNLFVFAATKTTGAGWTADHIYFVKYTASTGLWGSWVDWIDESSTGTNELLYDADRLTCFYQAYDNYIGLMYMTKTATPYNVKFASLVPISNWLPGWRYRKSHVINSASGAGTLYQVKIKAHYGSGTDSGEDVFLNSHARSDFGDVRFANDAILLNYWMESKVDSDYAIFWVQVVGNLSSSSVTIYIYYGNSDATTTSNGANTFIAFDNFEGTSTVGDRWYATYSNRDNAYHIGNYEDVQTESTSNTSAGGRSGLLKTKEWRPSLGQTTYYVAGLGEIHYSLGTATRVAVDFDYYIDTLTIGANYWVVYVFVVFKYSDGVYRMVRLKDIYNYGYEWRYNNILIDATTGYGITQGNTTVLTGDALQTWYSKDIKNIDYDLKDVVEVYVGVAGGQDNNTGYGSVIVYFDNLRVRKCVSPEPAHGAWGSEETSETYAQTSTESLGLAASIFITSTATNSELVSLSDIYSRTWTAQKINVALLTLTSTFMTEIQHLRAIVDSLLLVDNVRKQIDKSVFELLASSHVVKQISYKLVLELFFSLANIQKETRKEMLTSLALNASLTKTRLLLLTEALQLLEKWTRSFSHKCIESLRLLPAFSRLCSFILSLSASFTLQDKWELPRIPLIVFVRLVWKASYSGYLRWKEKYFAKVRRR